MTPPVVAPSRCAIHPTESAAACFACHLEQPCDEPECDRAATHNGVSKSGAHGRKWCNTHTSWDHPAFARDD